MSQPELDAFVAEAQRTERTLHDIGSGDWSRPGLGEWTLTELAFHLVRQADRLVTYLDRPLRADSPTVDRHTYFAGSAGLAADVSRRTRESAAGVDPTTLPAAFADAWRQTRNAGADSAALIETIAGTMRTDEYLATRVVEIVVHNMDVRRALDLAPDADPQAARLVADLAEGMLTGDRPRGLGRTRFILAATGRIEHPDPRLPVLA